MIPRKVFVGSLPQGSKPEELRRLFEKYGVVTECDILNRCGFVHMATAEQADAAIKALNNALFNGVNIVVERGRMKPQGSLGSGPKRGGQMGGNNRNSGPPGMRGGNSRGGNIGGGFRGNNMGGGMNQQQIGGPMRQNRQNDRQQSRNTPYNKNQRGGGVGRSFQRDNMGGNNSQNMGRFDNNMQMDSRQGMNNFDRGMNNNSMMDRNRGGFNDDNSFGFSEDRRGFALPPYSNDINPNNFGNDRQNNSMGNMGNRRNTGGAPQFMAGQSFDRRNQNMGNNSSGGVGNNKFQNNDMFTRRSGQGTGINRNQNNSNNFDAGNFGGMNRNQGPPRRDYMNQNRRF